MTSLTLDQQQKIQRILAEFPDKQFETFWQDRWYSSKGKWGYPVCLNVINAYGAGQNASYIMAWRLSQAGCEVALEAIDAYIAEQKAVKS